MRQQVNEIYEEIKNKLEHKSVTLEHVFYSHQATEGKGGDQEPNVNAMQNVTKDGIIRNFARIQITITSAQAERIIKDVRMANDNKFEITYKEFIDFMTRKRINVTFLERGFVDPILASTVSRIVAVRDQYEITFEQLFDIFCQNKKSVTPTLEKEQFIESI